MLSNYVPMNYGYSRFDLDEINLYNSLIGLGSSARENYTYYPNPVCFVYSMIISDYGQV